MKKERRHQYFRFPRELLESPAWWVLSVNEHRALDRILLEHQRKSGYVKDGLVVTQRDFLGAGIHPRHVASSLRVLEALGIVRCTRNWGGSKTGRTPNKWIPTFLPTDPTAGAPDDATHDYLKIETRKEAQRIAERHRFHELRKGRTPHKYKPYPFGKLKPVYSSPSVMVSICATDPNETDAKSPAEPVEGGIMPALIGCSL